MKNASTITRTPISLALRLLLASSSLFALAACTTLGPNFAAPAVNTPTNFKNASATAPNAAPANGEIRSDWWWRYNDDTLNALETRALEGSPSLQAIAARVEQSRAQFGVARSAELPSASFDASAQRFRTSAAIATSARTATGQPINVEANQYQAAIGAGYEIDFWGKIRRSVESANAQLAATERELDTAKLLLTTDIASNYWQWRGLQNEDAILAQTIGSREDALRVVQSRFDGGSTNELDLSRARTELANARADAADVKRRISEAESLLALLTGQRPDELQLKRRVASDGVNDALYRAPLVSPGLPSELLQRRPDIAQATALLHAASAQIGVADAARYPSIKLTGNFGVASSELSSLSKSPASLFGVGPSISIPLFDGGRNEANLQTAKYRFEEARANFSQRVLIAFREVEDALVNIEARGEQLKSLTEALSASSRAEQVARTRYDVGVANYLEVTDAERSRLAAERARTQVAAAIQVANVQLIKALGGGFASS